jgi:class 3 adenylate cyclase
MAAVGRFVVILAAVVADYTRLVEADEEPAREQLDALCRQAVFPKVAQHNGRIARTSGESLLVEFADPTEAVRCAVDVQRGMIDRDHAAAPERRIAFRVGISMGEMRASGDDLVSRAVAALPIDELATLIRPGPEFMAVASIWPCW